MTKEEFEAKIIDALCDAGRLHTLGAENGVEIDTSGPSEGGTIPVEGWHRHDGGKAYFAATIMVTLDDYAPNYDEED